MRIALAQINPTIGDFPGNRRRIAELSERARGLGCDVVIFPELAVSGYPPRDLLEKPDFLRANRRSLDRLIDGIQGIGVVVGTLLDNPQDGGKPVFNGAVLFEEGKWIGEAAKRLLPTYDVFDERRYFQPGTDVTPIPYKGYRLGLTICEDAWNDKDFFKRRMYDLDPVALLVEAGADLIINISASPYHLGKREFRDRMLSSLARKHGVPVIFVNQTGGNDDVVFDGISGVYGPDGGMIVRASDFEEDFLVCDISGGCADVPSGDRLHPVSETGAASVLKALVTGTRDYVAKCGFSKVVIGLSGGIDSALTTAVAVRALGNDNVSTVFMPSPYTSRDNFEDTRRLAENLKVGYRIIPIEEMFQAFLHHLVPDFDPLAPSVTEQNIQARIRGVILMAISNRTGAMVLSTGNKSELAVGYCTLYGDMSGGLAVISDVPKTMVYELSRLINRNGDIIPSRIIDKPPSAELKPNQTDQDDLPEYPVLDAILKGYIEEFKGPDELSRDGFDPLVVREVIRRVDLNEYKRHQAAPGIKVTSKAFGYGRRFPIAQGYRYTVTRS
ncbi:MAG: NAD+ synthase [Desulfobacterales bacterium]